MRHCLYTVAVVLRFIPSRETSTLSDGGIDSRTRDVDHIKRPGTALSIQGANPKSSTALSTTSPARFFYHIIKAMARQTIAII